MCHYTLDYNLYLLSSHFEFQQSGEHCMYNSGSVEITAKFSECYPGSPTTTCNCLLRIKILTGVYANQFVVIDSPNGSSNYFTTTQYSNDKCLDNILVAQTPIAVISYKINAF